MDVSTTLNKILSVNKLILTADGTFTVPSTIIGPIRVIGCGGGGGGSKRGGGGAPVLHSVLDVSPNQVINYTIGLGGAPNTDGTQSTFGSLIFPGGFAGGTQTNHGQLGINCLGGALGGFGGYSTPEPTWTGPSNGGSSGYALGGTAGPYSASANAPNAGGGGGASLGPGGDGAAGYSGGPSGTDALVNTGGGGGGGTVGIAGGPRSGGSGKLIIYWQEYTKNHE